ncbi:MAG: hypothetical protein N3C61_03305 [Candidatus Micrarchaeota archaeon]|nr:hypothetical protein [Candidatus Micrarchaeota archaeon]
MGPKFYMLKNQEKSKVKMKGIPEANEKMFVDLLNSENNNADIESIYTVQKLYGYLRNRLAYIPPTTTYMMAKHVILDNLIKKRIPIKPINKFSDFKNRIDTVPIELKGDICHKKTGLSQNLELEYNKFIYGYD